MEEEEEEEVAKNHRSIHSPSNIYKQPSGERLPTRPPLMSPSPAPQKR